MRILGRVLIGIVLRFALGAAATARAQVIARYCAWLLRNEALVAALPELRGKDLVCWCAPCACHGEVLLKLANADKPIYT